MYYYFDRPLKGLNPFSRQSMYFSNLSTYFCFPWACVLYYMGGIQGKCCYNGVYIHILKYIYLAIHISYWSFVQF